MNLSPSSFSVVVFSDLDFHPSYDTARFENDPTAGMTLANLDASQWASFFQASSITTGVPRGSDTNYPLLTLAWGKRWPNHVASKKLFSIKQNVGTGKVILHFGRRGTPYVRCLTRSRKA